MTPEVTSPAVFPKGTPNLLDTVFLVEYAVFCNQTKATYNVGACFSLSPSCCSHIHKNVFLFVRLFVCLFFLKGCKSESPFSNSFVPCMIFHGPVMVHCPQAEKCSPVAVCNTMALPREQPLDLSPP